MANPSEKLSASLAGLEDLLATRTRRGWLQRWLNPLPEAALLSAVRDATLAARELAASQAVVQDRLTAIEDILGKLNTTLVQHESRLNESDALRAKLGLLSAQVTALAAHADATQSSLAHHNEQLKIHDASLEKTEAGLMKLLRDRGPDRPEEFARFYLAFENQFRGTREEIAAKHAPYLPHVAAALERTGVAPWLDVGCGRGEWLEMLHAQGAAACGVDDNPAMLQACRERNLSVVSGDALEHLEAQPAGTLAGVSAFHVIEHLPYRTMLAFFHAAHVALAKGGCLIVETPNPQNVSVGACNFYMDLTHQKPIPPMTAEFVARHAGFADVKVLRLHPAKRHAERDSLPTVTDREYCEMFYGPQDYAIIAVK